MEKSFPKWVRNYPLIIFVLVILLLIEGCGGKKEVEQLGFVMGIGIDSGRDPGKYKVTCQLALPKSGGGNGTETQDWTITSEVSTMSGVIENISQVLNKSSFAGTARVIILGEGLARSDINEALDHFQRYYDFRRTIYLVLARGEAKDILETQLRSKQLPALDILGTIQGQPTFSSFPVTRLGHYLTILGRANQNPVIPVVQKTKRGEKEIEYADEKGEELLLEGAGVFENGKLVDFLSDEEAKGFMWLDNTVKNRFINAETEGLILSAWVRKTSTKFKIKTNADGKEGITFQIKTKASIDEIKGKQKSMNLEEWKEYTKSLEPVVAQAIEKECRAAVDKSKAIHADFIGIGRKVEQKDPKFWNQVKPDWLNQLSDFPVSYDIQVTLEHAGLPLNSPVSPQKSGQE